MPKALKITRAPSADAGPVLMKREGKLDLVVNAARPLLTVETEPVGHDLDDGKRWRVYRLYENESGTALGRDKLVVAEEGHSTWPGESTRYSVTICEDGAKAWLAMGRIEELKPILAELNWPAVETL